MLLLHQATNHHLKLVTSTPTTTTHYVMIPLETIFISRVIYLFKNKISSFDEIKVSTLNEPQNSDFTTGEKQEAEERKIKTAAPSEWKSNETKLLRNGVHAN